MKRNYKDIYGYRMKNRTGEWKKQEKEKFVYMIRETGRQGI